MFHGIRLLRALFIAPFFSCIFFLSLCEASVDWDCSSKLSVDESNRALRVLEDAYSQIGGFSSYFLQESYLSALDTVESSRGTVLFRRPGMMRWSYTDPEPQEFVLIEDQVKMYQRNLQQGFIDRLDRVLLSDLPVSFLSGVGKISERFRLDTGCRGARGIILKLAPKDGTKDSQLTALELITGNRGELLGGRVTDAIGNYTAILLEVRTGGSIPEPRDFDFVFPEGTDVQDRRIKE